QLVHDHAVFLFHVHRIALHHVPRFAKPAAGMEADDLNVFHAAVGLFPVGKILDVLFGLFYPGRRQDFVIFALREHAAGVEVADPVEDDPEIGVGMIDIVGGGGGETEEQAELNNDEHQGENNAGEGDRETDAVVKEVAASEESHGSELLVEYKGDT